MNDPPVTSGSRRARSRARRRAVAVLLAMLAGCGGGRDGPGPPARCRPPRRPRQPQRLRGAGEARQAARRSWSPTSTRAARPRVHRALRRPRQDAQGVQRGDRQGRRPAAGRRRPRRRAGRLRGDGPQVRLRQGQGHSGDVQEIVRQVKEHLARSRASGGRPPQRRRPRPDEAAGYLKATGGVSTRRSPASRSSPTWSTGS